MPSYALEPLAERTYFSQLQVRRLEAAPPKLRRPRRCTSVQRSAVKRALHGLMTARPVSFEDTLYHWSHVPLWRSYYLRRLEAAPAAHCGVELAPWRGP